jgi:hypothetical protein
MASTSRLSRIWKRSSRGRLSKRAPRDMLLVPELFDEPEQEAFEEISWIGEASPFMVAVQSIAVSASQLEAATWCSHLDIAPARNQLPAATSVM